MDNTVLKEYERLNDNGKTLVNAAIVAAASDNAFLNETSEEEMEEIKRKNEENKRKRQLEDDERHQYLEKLYSEIDDYTKQDYISKLNELFSNMPLYKLRYFYIFIRGKLHYDAKDGDTV